MPITSIFSLSSLARSVLVLFSSVCVGALPAFAQDVLTYHNNNARTGLYNKETILTTSNVNAASFGKCVAHHDVEVGRDDFGQSRVLAGDARDRDHVDAGNSAAEDGESGDLCGRNVEG